MFSIRYRHALALSTLVGVAVALIGSVAVPQTGRRSVRPYQFPEAIPLARWEHIHSQPIPFPAQDRQGHDRVMAAQRYTYKSTGKSAGITVEIKAFYIVGTLGNVKGFVEQWAPVNGDKTQETQARQSQETIQNWMPQSLEGGSYGLFTDGNWVYLSSCVNPRGGSTWTDEEFLHNRHQFDIRLKRLLPVLLGQESLRDRRCVWSHLAMPTRGQSVEVAFTQLTEVWKPWLSWWTGHFPAP